MQVSGQARSIFIKADAAALNVTTTAHLFGVRVGVGYLVATMTNTATNPNMPHPNRNAAVSGRFFVLTSVVSPVILVRV